MSAFEFFFSFYGLLLGLSVAELVGGFARVLHERERIRFGWLTPALALFVAIDIATFWNQAWVIFRGAPFNIFLLLVSLSIAATFYVAASVTFPRVSAEGAHERVDLDAHFWANKRAVMLLLVLANLLMMSGSIWMSLPKNEGLQIAVTYAFNMSIYLVLVIPAALTRRAWLFAFTMGLHIALYLVLAVVSVVTPAAMMAASIGPT